MSDFKQSREEERINKAIADFKENPEGWDAEKMGDAAEIRQVILNRLLNSADSTSGRKIVFRRVIAIAASLIIITGALWFGFAYQGNSSKTTVAYVNEVMVKTGKDDIRKLKLDDGSIVWLNENSVFRYPEQFGAAKREVDLVEGEAYFDIHHEPGRPFQVKAGKTLTNVLGTAFNISSYARFKTISVTVARGKVAVNNAILLPNQQLLYTKASGHMEQKKVSAGNVTAWMQPKFAFNNQDFKTVAARIEAKYDVKIRFAVKNIEDYRITARFDGTDGLEDILAALTMTLGLKYQIEDNNILITN